MRLVLWLYFMLGFFFASGLYAQGDGGLEKNRREQNRAFRALPVECQGDSIRQSLAMRHWIVEIDRVPGRRGASIPMEPGRFFVAVKGDTAFICVDRGGKSVDCSNLVQAAVDRYIVSKDENQAIYTIDMTVEGFSIKVEVNPSRAVAWMNISGKRMRKGVFVGQIVPLGCSPLYRASVGH